MTGSYLVV